MIGLGFKTSRVNKAMKIGFLMTWIVATGVALVFALKPQALQIDIQGADKIMHFAAFAALAFMPVITFEKMRNIVLGLLFVALIAVGIEVVQHYMPTRKAELMDVVFDGIGIMAGTALGFFARAIYQSIFVPAYNKL